LDHEGHEKARKDTDFKHWDILLFSYSLIRTPGVGAPIEQLNGGRVERLQERARRRRSKRLEKKINENLLRCPEAAKIHEQLSEKGIVSFAFC
jgi:hypothetical protein